MWRTSWRGYCHSICRYPISVEHRSFPSSSRRWTVEVIWGTLWNARCILSQSNWSVSPFGFFFTRWERKRTDERTRHWRTWWIICPGNALIATLWEGGRGFRTLRIMITSILYLQRERTLVVSGILIAQPSARGYVYTHVRERTSDLCVLPLEFIGSRWAKFGNGRGREKKRDRTWRKKRRGTSPRKSPKVVNQAKVTRPSRDELDSVDPRSLGPSNFPSIYRNLQLFDPHGSAKIRPFVFVTRDCNRWLFCFLFFIQGA